MAVRAAMRRAPRLDGCHWRRAIGLATWKSSPGRSGVRWTSAAGHIRLLRECRRRLLPAVARTSQGKCVRTPRSQTALVQGASRVEESLPRSQCQWLSISMDIPTYIRPRTVPANTPTSTWTNTPMTLPMAMRHGYSRWPNCRLWTACGLLANRSSKAATRTWQMQQLSWRSSFSASSATQLDEARRMSCSCGPREYVPAATGEGPSSSDPLHIAVNGWSPKRIWLMHGRWRRSYGRWRWFFGVLRADRTLVSCWCDRQSHAAKGEFRGINACLQNVTAKVTWFETAKVQCSSGLKAKGVKDWRSRCSRLSRRAHCRSSTRIKCSTISWARFAPGESWFRVRKREDTAVV